MYNYRTILTLVAIVLYLIGALVFLQVINEELRIGLVFIAIGLMVEAVTRLPEGHM